jgi:hypothetical protein
MRFPGVATKDLTKGESASFLPCNGQSCGYVGVIIELQRKLMPTLSLDTVDMDHRSIGASLGFSKLTPDNCGDSGAGHESHGMKTTREQMAINLCEAWRRITEGLIQEA